MGCEVWAGSKRRGYSCLLALGGLLGCSVLPESTSDAPAAPLTCTSDAECSNGHCLLAFGVCSVDQGELTHLLFEITPPASDPVYGGAHFLKVLDLDAAELDGVPERGIEPGWIELNVRPRVPVSGSVSAPPDQSACPSGASNTLPVTLTFTPRERLFGLSVPSYDLVTSLDPITQQYTFRGSLPPGSYDVYMRPNSAALSEGCVAIPQIFHNRRIGETFAPLEQDPPPAPLQLTFLGDDDHEGWVVDIVHPVTGEVISNRVRLGPEQRDPVTDTLQAKLYYSRDKDDFIGEGAELVRLTPPPEQAQTAGTVFLTRGGLTLADPDEGRIGDVFQFGKPVTFQAWVWKKSESDAAVPATVSFAARELDSVPRGVFSSFGGSARVDARGQVRVSLLPGEYRVRVTPPGVEDAKLGQLSSSETTVTVWPNDRDDASVQGGNVLEVPSAGSLAGRVVTEVGGQRLANVEVRASAASSEQDPCSGAPGGPMAAACAPRAVVLNKALALDPFVPRTRTALSGSDGGFLIRGLDCRECTPGAGVRLDITVRPPVELRLPWYILRSYLLYRDQSLPSPLRVPRPVAHALRLTYGDPAGLPDGAEPGTSAVPALAGALVRVYALLDDQSQVIKDQEPAEPCVTVSSGSGRCVQSVVQVAELRSGNDGEFLLLLPPSLK